MGYYGDDPDNELIGRYCPSCEEMGDGSDGYGDFADEDLDELGTLGQDDEYYGQYPEDDELGDDEGVGFHGPIGHYGGLSGYERERSVNPSCNLRRVPPSRMRHVPDFFRPHF